MPTITRRRAMGWLSAATLELCADPLGLPVGFQIYPVREMIAKDFAGILRELAAAGYQAVEMCSPPGYERSGFASLVNMKASQVREIIQGAGLRCPSSHYQFRELKENLAERIAYAKELGQTQMILSTFGLPQSATMDDWRRAAEELNPIGAETLKAGLQLGFHNHAGEFKELDGVLVYDELMRRFDPKLVKMQFQVSVLSLGFEAATYFTKYPGRFCSIHLQDMSSDKRTVAIGKGVVDWKKLFTAAKTAGVKNYFVEVNLDALKASCPYLHELKV